MASPVIRGSGIQNSSAASYTVTWPTGTLAGDLAIILAGHANTITIPAGWSSVDTLYNGASIISGAVFTKTLTSADITAGSVTVTTGGTNNGVLAIVTFVGAFNITTSSAQSTSGVSSVIGPVLLCDASSTALYFAVNEASTSTDTVSQGGSQQTNSGTNFSGCLYAETVTVAKYSAPTYTFSVAGTGYYIAQVQVVVAAFNSYTGGVTLPVKGRTLNGTGGGVTLPVKGRTLNGTGGGAITSAKIFVTAGMTGGME